MKYVTPAVYLVIALCALVVLGTIASSIIAHCAPAPTSAAKQHDAAIKTAIAHRDSTKRIADSLEHDVVKPAYAKDAAARQELRRVVAEYSTLPVDVDSLKAALQVTTTAAVRLDTASMQAIGALVALVAAKSAQASASDTVAARATSALEDERRDRNRERWIYRAKIAGALLGGAIIGAIASRI
jgi:hypothetical protein